MSSGAIKSPLRSVQVKCQISSVEFWLISKGGAFLLKKKKKSVGKREVPILKPLNVILLLLTYMVKEGVSVYDVMSWDRVLCCDHLDDYIDIVQCFLFALHWKLVV